MKKTWSWSVSGLQIGIKSHEPIRDLCRKAGLAGIEGAVPLFEGKSARESAEIGDAYRRAGLKIDSFHLPYRPGDDIASFYATERREAVAEMRRWMEIAAAAGCRVCIQHPTTKRFDPEVEGVDRCLRAIGKALEELLPAAEELGLVLAIENMLPGPSGSRLGARPEHFELFLREFDHPALGFCLDTGHALVAGHGRAGEFLDAMEPKVAAFHLADNPGDRDSHLAPGHGRVDWKEVFRKMAALGFDHPACIETPPFAFGPDYSTGAWAELVADTDALVERVLEE